MRHQISWSDEAVLHVLFPVLLPLLLLTGVVRSGQPISGLPDDGGFDMPERSDGAKVGHLRHAFSILEPELAQSVWSREGLKNPIRRTTTIPMNDRLDIGNTGELQPKGANKPMKRRPRKAETVSEYDTLNDDFLTEYDLLNLDFSLDEPQDGKKSAKEVEVPEKEFEWEEGEKRKGEENFPPKEWWDLEEPTEGSSTTATTKKQTLKGTKLFVVKEDGSSRNAEEQEHSLERESGRVRRDAAKTQSAGQTLRGIAEWSGEAAIERDEVKIWPKLVPVTSKSEPSPILWPPVPTTKRPQTVPKEEGKKRISGGNDDELQTNGESRKEKKKEEVFRDLPSGVEVVSSLVEKAVENGQKSRNKTQRQKIMETLGKATNRGRVGPKKQNRPAQQMPRILDRDSPEPTNSGRTAPMKKDGKMASKNSEPQQKQTEKSSEKMQEEDRSLDSLPTIIIGDPLPAENQSEQKFKSEALNVSFSNGNEKVEQNATKQQQNGRPKGQIEVAPADHSPQLPPGFVYLATVDTLPKDGRLLIGNRSYVIEKTLLQRHLFPEQQRKVVANDSEFGGTNERHGKMEGEEHSQSERMNIGHTDEEKGRGGGREGGGGRAERGQQMMEGRTVIGSATARGKSARRLTPRHKAFVVATSQQVPPPPPGTVNDHFAIVQNSQNGKAQQSDRKTDILARHLGMTLSQIFGNFTLGHFPANSGKKATMGNEKQQSQEVKTDSKMDSENGGRTDGGKADGGKADGGKADGGRTDGGKADGGKADGGKADGGKADGGRTDGGRTDGGRTDQVVSEPHRLTRVFEKKRP